MVCKGTVLQVALLVVVVRKDGYIMHVPFNSPLSFLHPSHPYLASHTLRQIGPLNIAFKSWISPDGCSTLTRDLLILVSH